MSLEANFLVFRRDKNAVLTQVRKQLLLVSFTMHREQVQRDQGQRNSLQNMKSWRELTENSLSGRYT